ncbi:hypothetical protein Afil01_62560 [Actinorhabdospora filicis]|uniref:Uncharacterized protein n=1 Tax=Actinorhabdospora filicis TaxID=1785913 RepID=A0A9W6SR80_9ACTN|nr:hypothetical protein [Actinorhabdospora filicis]GLZ81449.1 hypothetical protein Afil01_62560 [Actinorhabdospora filicis]
MRPPLRRAGTLAALVAVLLTLITLAAPTGAFAACAPGKDVADHYFDGGGGWWYGYKYVSVADGFLKSEGHSYVNNTDNGINWSRETEQTVSWTVTTSGSLSTSSKQQFVRGLEVQNTFSFTRGTSYTETSRTRESFSTVISPRTILYADYGNIAYQIGYVFRVFYRNTPGQYCAIQGQTGVEQAVVPSKDQRWVFTATPV